MNIKHVVEALRLSLNLLQQINRLLGRTAPPTPPRDRTKRTAVVRATPTPVAAAPALAPRRGGRWLRATRRMIVTGTVAGVVAYVVVKRQQRAAQRSRPLHAPFASELLDVLASPGGGRTLFYSGDALIDPDDGSVYPVVDGIPDFLDAGAAGHRAAPPDAARPHPARLLRQAVKRTLLPAVSLGDRAGQAAYAGAIACAAAEGWCLSVPCGPGALEVEMARANPGTRILCLDSSWENLREARLRAVEAGLLNLYFARAAADLLPVQSGAFHSAWSAGGFHLDSNLEQAVVELTRAVRPGGLLAGASWVRGGGQYADALLRRLAGVLPGSRDITAHFALLAAAGVRRLRAVRYGPVVRFMGERT